jgi:hypothetical protein
MQVTAVHMHVHATSAIAHGTTLAERRAELVNLR